MSVIEPPRVHLKQIMMPHLDAASNLSRWLAGNDTDADKIALQACLRAIRSPECFPGANGRSWLLAIVRNTAYGWLRQHRPDTVVSAENDGLSATGNPMAVSNHSSALHDVNRDALRAAMESLSVEFREALVLHELEGLSYKEIADIAEVSIGTIMCRLAYARKGLLEHLGRKRD